MNLQKAEQLAMHLLEKHKRVKFEGLIHLLDEWTFTWNRRKRAFGTCSYSTKQIQLSIPLTAHRSEEDVKNTILHEIAHAVVGPIFGHGNTWKRAAIHLGHPSPTARHYEAIPHDYKWLLIHGSEVFHGWFRKPKYPSEYYCPKNRPELQGKCSIVPAQAFSGAIL